MKKNLSWQLALSLICILLGFGITLQLKSVALIDTKNPEKTRLEDVIKELNSVRKHNEELYSQLIQVQNELNKFREAAQNGSDITKILTEQLSKAEGLAGLTELEGPGISVVLNDAKLEGRNLPAGNTESFIIHDTDIRSVINEMLASGAEAIAINDERIVSTSSIRCVGPTVVVNTSRFATPFEIRAIGKTETLEAGLNLKNGIVEQLRQWGIGVEIKRSNKINIPAYKGYVNFKFATPIKKGQ